MLGRGFPGAFLCNSSMGAKSRLSTMSAVRSPVYVKVTVVDGVSFMVHALLHYQPSPASHRSTPQQGRLGMPVAPLHLLCSLLLTEMVPAGEENLLFCHAGGYFSDFYMYI